MGNVQNYDSYINILSSQTYEYRSHVLFLLGDFPRQHSREVNLHTV
jgi:hypothetical protein